MSLNDMFADMLKKAIPPEVAALLTEEKVKEFGAKANGFVAELRGRLETIETRQATILNLLEEIRSNDIADLRERLRDDNGSNSDGTDSPKPRSRRSSGGTGDK